MRCEAIDMIARPRVAGMACEGCGCTDDRACPGGCSWVSIDPPVCSQCMTEDGNEPAGSFFNAQACEASRTGAGHVPLWLNEREGYCARCHEGFTT